MNPRLQSGRCAACGRAPGRHHWRCPYCGERVRHPPSHRLAAAASLLLPPAAWLLARPAWPATADTPAWLSLLLATGTGLILLPPPRDTVTAASLPDLLLRRAVSLGGAVLMGVYTFAGALCLTHHAGWPQGLAAACLTWLAAATFPFFIKIPVHCAAGAACIAAATAIRVLVYAA